MGRPAQDVLTCQSRDLLKGGIDVPETECPWVVGLVEEHFVQCDPDRHAVEQRHVLAFALAEFFLRVLALFHGKLGLRHVLTKRGQFTQKLLSRFVSILHDTSIVSQKAAAINRASSVGTISPERLAGPLEGAFENPALRPHAHFDLLQRLDIQPEHAPHVLAHLSPLEQLVLLAAEVQV